MKASTGRRGFHNIFTPRCSAITTVILACAFALIGSAAQAQVICPFPQTSGNNQTALAGTRFAVPLTVGQTNATAPTPSSFQIDWSVSSPRGNPAVYFQQSLSTSHSETVTWSGPPFSYSSSVDVLAAPGSAGSYIIRAGSPACVNGLQSQFNLNVVAPSMPGVNPFQGSSQSAVTGTAFGTSLGVVVSDSSSPVSNAKVVYTVTAGPAQFSNGTTSFTTFTASDGHAFADLVANSGVNMSTPVTVQVDALGVTQTYSGITVTPAGAPTVTHAPPSSGAYATAPGTDFADFFTITIAAAGGGPAVGVPVNFQLSTSAAGAQLLNGSSTPIGTSATLSTSTDGTIGVGVRAGTTATFTLTATTSTMPPTTTVWNLDVSGSGGGDAVLVAISGDGQVAPPQSEFAQDLVVEAQNDGTPLGGVPVTFTVRSGDVFFLDANGVPVRTKTVTTTTAAPGARTSVFSGDPGNAQIDVTAPGYASTAFALLVQAQQASLIKQSGDGQQGPTNSQLPLPLVAMLPPNTVSSQNAVITFEVIGGSATFVESNGTTASVPVTDQRGSVRLLLGAQPGDVQVRASYPGLQSVVFNARAVQPTNSLTLLKIAGDGQLGTTGLASAPLRVRLTRNGQPISQGDVDWRVVSGDATLSETHTKTDDRGETQVTLALGDDAGGIRVRVDARDSGSGESASTEFQLGSDDATLTAVSGSGQNGAIGTDADQVFVFELRGADGSPLAGQTIQFQTSSGALASPSAITASDGRVSARLRYGSNAGQVQVTAFAFDGRVHAVGVASTFVPLLSIAGGNNQSAPAGAQLPNPLVIQISRPAAASMAKGLQGLTVQWSVVSGGGTLASAMSVTDAEGRSSNTLRLGPTLGAQQIKASIAEVGEVVFSANATLPANSVLEIVSGNNQQVVPRRPSEPLVVRLRTSTGTAIAGFVVKFVPSDGASVDPIEVTTNQDGRASTVVNVTLPGDYTITASVPAVAAITPVVFNLGNGIANLIEVAGANRRIARAIDKACPRLAQAQNLTPAQQDLLQRCSELVVAARDNGGAVAGALDTMLADESSAQNNAALQSAAAQFENIKGRFAALRSGSSGINMGGLAILTPSGRLPLSFLPSNLLLGAAEEEQPQVPDSFSRWGFFATGTIGRGSRDAGDTDPGGDFDNYGLTAGIDYRLTDSFILGGALGFNSNDSSLKQNLGGLDSRGYSLSAYGTWFKGDSYYADGVLTVGRTSTDVTRRIEYTIPGLSGGSTAIRQIATGSPDNDQRSFALSVGRDFNRGALSFGPYLRGTYTKLDFDGYIERMSDPNGPGAGLALAVDERSLTSMQAVLGAKLGYTVSTSWGVLMPSVQIEYVKELEDDPDGLVTRFAFDPTNTAIVIDGDEIDTDYLNIGIGLSGVFADGRSGYIYYEHVAGKDRISQDSLAIGIRIEF